MPVRDTGPTDAKKHYTISLTDGELRFWAVAALRRRSTPPVEYRFETGADLQELLRFMSGSPDTSGDGIRMMAAGPNIARGYRTTARLLPNGVTLKGFEWKVDKSPGSCLSANFHCMVHNPITGAPLSFYRPGDVLVHQGMKTLDFAERSVGCEDLSKQLGYPYIQGSRTHLCGYKSMLPPLFFGLASSLTIHTVRGGPLFGGPPYIKVTIESVVLSGPAGLDLP